MRETTCVPDKCRCNITIPSTYYPRGAQHEQTPSYTSPYDSSLSEFNPPDVELSFSMLFLVRTNQTRASNGLTDEHSNRTPIAGLKAKKKKHLVLRNTACRHAYRRVTKDADARRQGGIPARVDGTRHSVQGSSWCIPNRIGHPVGSPTPTRLATSSSPARMRKVATLPRYSFSNSWSATHQIQVKWSYSDLLQGNRKYYAGSGEG